MSSGARNPGAIVAGHGIEGHQELTGDGNHGDLLGLAGSEQTGPKRGEMGITANGGAGRHIQRLTHTGTPAGDHSPATEVSALTGHRRQPDQRGGLPSGELPQLGQIDHQGPTGLGPHTRRGAQLHGSLTLAGAFTQSLLDLLFHHGELLA